MDGVPILDIKLIQGKFIDIPTYDFLREIFLREDRLFFLNKFIEKCKEEFKLRVEIKKLCLNNGEEIWDLIEIPNKDNFIYISIGGGFSGITIINQDKQITKRYFKEEDDGNDKVNKKNKNQNSDSDFVIPRKSFLETRFIKDIAYNYGIKNKRKSIYDLDDRKNSYIGENIDISFYDEKNNKNNENENKYKINNFELINNTFDIGEFFNKIETSKNNENNENKQISNNSISKEKNKNLNNKKNNNININFNKIPKDKLKLNVNFSDDEKLKAKTWDFIKQKYKNKYQLSIDFNEFIYNNNLFILKNRIRTKIEDLPENIKNKSKLEGNIEDFVINFNKKIRDKITSLDVYMKNKRKNINKTEKILLNFNHKNYEEINKIENYKKDISSNLMIIMKKFIEILQIFPKIDKEEKSNLDLKRRKINISKNTNVEKNIKKNLNVFYLIETYVNTVLPNLFEFNIPKILKKYKHLTRIDIYELFAQYKSLMKICIVITNDPSSINKGINFISFYKGVEKLRGENIDLVKMIFETLDKSKNGFISFDEFLSGMNDMKSDDIKDKLNFFFKIIDSNGDGSLSWDEVFKISLMSLSRNMQSEEVDHESIIIDLSNYFAELIFKMVDMDKKDSIPFEKIKEVIFFLIFL